ncbi:cytochrome P450 71AU50-like [Magnolia sinica]|uniref:cytochrome P450 71AU50-like n=1 Tax=Magnolia sinica TaxID=86752 RepID=UPI00265AE532|nr:cytochrome P450 71AU50-like [Magnolia sinica]
MSKIEPDKAQMRISGAMPAMFSWWTTVLFVAVAVVVCGVWSFSYLLHASKDQKKRLPPGPTGLPIIGNLHMLGHLPHRTLHSLAQKYGPIMYMRLGMVPTVIVSSPQAAQQILKTHDAIFASRPYTEAGKYLSYNRKGVAFAEHGQYWRDIRKLCMLELLSNAKIDSFRSMRREELGRLIRSLKDTSDACAVVDLTDKVGSLSAGMTCRMVFGKKSMDEDYDGRGIIARIHEGMMLAGAFNIADYIPYTGLLDVQGLTRRMKAFTRFFDDLFERVVDDHIRTREVGHQRDFIDVMLALMASNHMEINIDRTNCKAIVMDMLTGAADTSSAVIEWALSELFRHPLVMKKAQEELEAVVGMDRIVDESDLVKLEYLEMVVKETLRLHPVAPLLVPHEAVEDCVIDGFNIPKKCRVIINAWAIARNPIAWSNAEEFYPERFDGLDIDVRGRHFQLIPFGSGRRGCPGIQLGLTVFRLVLAQLVHCFDWELPNGMGPTDLDMTEKFSLVVPRANHLLAIPKYRLRDGCL